MVYVLPSEVSRRLGMHDGVLSLQDEVIELQHDNAREHSFFCWKFIKIKRAFQGKILFDFNE